jgi:hypothetical protein
VIRRGSICGSIFGIATANPWPVFLPPGHLELPGGSRDKPLAEKPLAEKLLAEHYRRFIVIPGLDPGISTNSGGGGDPRIKSGDDESGIYRHLDPRIVGSIATPVLPRWRTL